MKLESNAVIDVATLDRSDRHKEFLKTIAPWRDAYQAACVSFVALREGHEHQVLQGRIDFLVSKQQMRPEARFESANVVAQRFNLAPDEPDWADWEELLQEMANGKLRTPDGVLPLYKSAFTYNSSVWCPPNDQWRRDIIFQVDGGGAVTWYRSLESDWELKAATPPYDGLIDLVTEFGLNAQQLDHAHLQAMAWHAAEIDNASEVGDSAARLAFFVAEGIDPGLVAINYRVRVGGETTRRGTLSGADMDWEQWPQSRRGIGKIEIPKGALIQCFAIVGGYCHHQYWLTNPRTLPNPHRAAFEQYDSTLSTMREFLFDTRGKGYDARDMEFAVSWLLWMHGFSPAVFGPNPRMQDAPDLLVTTPAGHFIAIECTLGTLKADHKLSKLHERTTSLRHHLNESGHTHLRILPAIVTRLSREEVKADIEQAERLGILVMAKEDLERALSESIVLQNAEAKFADAEKTVLDNQQRHAPVPGDKDGLS